MSIITHAKRIMAEWPTYRKYVESHGIDPNSVNQLTDLPLVSKKFMESAINAIPPFKVRQIIPSSGTTGGINSFGLFGDRELERTSGAINSFLAERFDTGNKSTLLLNMLPGGISINSSSITIASIGTRADTAINVIRSFGNSFDQIMLIAEPLFLKHLLEEGVEQSIPWKHFNLHIITGGEWFSESYRSYIESIVGFGRVQSSMGTAELGLNYFTETFETITLRRLINSRRELADVFFNNIDFVPMLFDYDEEKVFVETVNSQDDSVGSIILSTSDSDRVLPLIRYEIGDRGILLSREKLNETLISMGYLDMIDPAGGPILAHLGRGNNVDDIYPERIKEILFMQKETAFITTGQFYLHKEGQQIILQIQLNKNLSSTEYLRKIFAKSFSNIPVRAELVSFMEYPHALDFERKAAYFDESCRSQN